MRSYTFRAVAVAAVPTVVAVGALIVALTRPTAAPLMNDVLPTHAPAETVKAKVQLCDTYNLVARAVQVDTNGTNSALARIATTDGAVMLDNAAANPALDAGHRDAARALAAAYLKSTAMGNTSEADFHAALDDLIAKDADMKRVCG